MRAPVQYATTADGVRIAYAVHGSGDQVPLVALRPPQWSHVERELQLEMLRDFEDLAADRPVVRLDPRGSGLSDRRVPDYSLSARMSDVLAVVAELGIERFAIDGISSSGLVALALAARYPERTEGLSLQNAFASGKEWWSVSGRQSLVATAQIDWAVCTEVWAWLTFGSVGTEGVRALAAHTQGCMLREDFLGLVAAEREVDLRNEVTNILAPTLVVGHTVFSRLASPESNSELATLIPGARLAIVRSADERVKVLRSFLTGLPGAPRSPDRRTGVSDTLTARERDVLRLLAEGLTNRQIAERLVLSVRTVDSHAARIYAKTRTAGRAEVAAHAIRSGLV